MKKIFVLLAFLLVTGTTLAYTIYYTKTVQVNENVGVGNTVKAVDGLNITLLSKEQGNLTYYALEETTTDKHTLTYVYDYEILAGVYDIQVTSDTVDIVNYTISDVITIEFGLLQHIEYNEGDMIDISFTFDLIEYSVNNPFVIEQASVKQLTNFFPTLTTEKAQEIYNVQQDIISLTNYYAYTSLKDGDLNDYYTYELQGIIVFE